MTTNRRPLSPEELFEKAQAGRNYWLQHALDEYGVILLLPHADGRFNAIMLESFETKLRGMAGPDGKSALKAIVLSVTAPSASPFCSTAVIGKDLAESIITLYSMYKFTDKLVIGSLELPPGRNLKNMLDFGVDSEADLCDCLLSFMGNKYTDHPPDTPAASKKTDNKTFFWNNLNYLIKNGWLNNKTAFIYEHTDDADHNYTEELLNRLAENNIPAALMLDGGETDPGIYRNAPVKTPAVLKEYNAADSIVLINSLYFFIPLVKRLRALGYRGEIHHITPITYGNNLRDLIGNGRFYNKNVFVFGQTNSAAALLDYLNREKITVTAVLDNDKIKQNFTYRGRPVKDPSVIQDYDASGSVVLIEPKHFVAMEKQLRALGYGGEIYRTYYKPSAEEYSLSREQFARQKENVLSGIKRLEKIKAQYPGRHIVILTVYGLGDLYWAFSFLGPYCQKHGVREVAFVVYGNIALKKQLAELFPGNILLDFISLEFTEIIELIQALLFLREKNCLIISYYAPSLYTGCYFFGRNMQPYINCFRSHIYGLANDTRPALPDGQSGLSRPGLIEKGKTVILAPHAISCPRLPDDFWEELADSYRQKGYLVCTNVVGSQAPVKNTRALSVPINQIIAAAEYAGCFIGLRSGLCDILFTAKCRKIVVLPDCHVIHYGKIFKLDEQWDMPGWEKILYKC